VYNAIADSYIQKADWVRAIAVLQKAEGLDRFVVGPFRKEFLDTYQLFQSAYSGQRNSTRVRHYQSHYQVVKAQLDNIENLARIVKLEKQLQVKDQKEFLVWERQRDMQARYNYLKVILIPACLLLIILIWLSIKQSKIIRIYKRVLLHGMPDFDFDERKKLKN
jgi:hypothetical protein